MSWGCALCAEVTWSPHDAKSEMMLPEAVYDDSRQEVSGTLLLVRHPMGESDPGWTALSLFEPVVLGGIFGLQDTEERRGCEFVFRVRLPAFEKVDLTSIGSEVVGRSTFSGGINIDQGGFGSFLGMLIDGVVQLAPIWIPRGIPLQHLQRLLFIPGLFRQSENGVDLLRHLG